MPAIPPTTIPNMRPSMGRRRLRLYLARILLSQVDFSIRITGGERVHVGKAKIAGAIAAKGIHLLALDDREGRIDVAHVSAVCDAVEMEIEGVELRPEF